MVVPFFMYWCGLMYDINNINNQFTNHKIQIFDLCKCNDLYTNSPKGYSLTVNKTSK